MEIKNLRLPLIILLLPLSIYAQGRPAGIGLTPADSVAITRQLISTGFFSPEFLSKIGFLWFDRDELGNIFPGNGIITACSRDEVFRPHEDISISLYNSARYSVGDTIEILRSDRFVRFDRRIANLVRRVARAYITSVSGRQATARVLSASDVILCRDRIKPVTRFEQREIAGLSPPERAIEAAIVEHIENTESPYLHHTFICDRGSSGGLREGDLLAVYSGKTKRPSESASGLVCVVNVQATSSTVVIIKMHAERIKSGDRLKLVGRTMFK